jgi:RNA polymerase sigma-70 factor (sigma-E family)
VIGGAPVISVHEAPSAAQAITALYAQQYRSLMRQAIALVDHEPSAEEIVQDAFEQLVRRWSTLRDVDAATTYLRRSVLNGSRDRLRRRRTRRQAALPASAPAHSAEDAVLMTARDRELVDAVAGLPPRQREVIALRYFLDWTEAEVAEVLGISKGAVKSTGHKGLVTLRTRLKEVDQ